MRMESKRYIRHKRIRAKIRGTNRIPRLCVFRSNRHIHAQLVDDEHGKTIIFAKDEELKKRKDKKVVLAHEVGKLIAQKALDKKIEKAIFDKGGYKYHGTVKALAEGAREGGLKF